MIRMTIVHLIRLVIGASNVIKSVVSHVLGFCSECTAMFWGDNSQSKCNIGCHEKCSKTTGHCICKEGYFGISCGERCFLKCQTCNTSAIYTACPKNIWVKHATAVTQTVKTRATKTQDTASAREDITTETLVKVNVPQVPKRAKMFHAIPCPVFVSVSYISFSDSIYKNRK